MRLRRRKRPAYTLLEIILALTIAVLLLTALYGAVGYQLRQAQAGRDTTNQTTLSRSVFARIENDVVASLSLSDPARYRNQSLNAQQALAQQQSTQQSGGATSQASSASSASGSQQKTGGMTSGKTGASTTPSGGSKSGGTPSGGNNSGQQQQQMPQALPIDQTDDGSSTAQLSGSTNPVVLPDGVIGDNNTLTLYISKVPSELYGTRTDQNQGQPTSDLRRVTYWLADGGQGLCRQEVRVATSDDATTPGIPSGDLSNYLLAPEIKSLQFRYFDGTNWNDSWDSTLAGDDTVTPIGAPRAIEVRLGVLPPGGKEGDDLVYHRHVILIKTANGITQASAPGTTP